MNVKKDEYPKLTYLGAMNVLYAMRYNLLLVFTTLLKLFIDLMKTFIFLLNIYK